MASPVSKASALQSIFLIYFADQPAVTRLAPIFKKDLILFLLIFSGLKLRVPSSDEEVRETHLPKIAQFFGKSYAQVLRTRYPGSVFEIPVYAKIVEAVRAIDCYVQLRVQRPGHLSNLEMAKLLADRYQLRVAGIRDACAHVTKVMERRQALLKKTAGNGHRR